MKINEIRELQALAFSAAAEACNKMIADNPGQWYPCGFALVRIRPARGALVNHWKSLGIGHVDNFNGGYVVYNPSGNSTQWMDAKMAGARAFAEILRKYGINAIAESRVD